MPYFTMDKFVSKEALYKTKAEYLESVIDDSLKYGSTYDGVEQRTDGLYYNIWQGDLVGELK